MYWPGLVYFCLHESSTVGQNQVQCTVVGVDVWRKDGGCGVPDELFGGRYFNAIVNNAEDEPRAWAMMKAKVEVLLGRQSEE